MKYLSATLLLLIGASVGYAVSHTSPAQVVCSINHSGWDTDGWQMLHESERYRRAEDRYSEIRAFPDAVVCTWDGQVVPTSGALWFWRPVPSYKVTSRSMG